MSDKIKPSEVSQVLLDQLKGVTSSANFDEVGTVLTVSDGVARIYGLRNAEANELLEFENGTMAIVMNLEEDNVGCVLLSAQERDYKFAYWGHPDQMVLAQAQFMFDQVDKALDACPPVPERSGVEPEGKDASRLLLRRSTLLNLDAVIHQFARPDTLSSLLGFMDSRIGKVAADLRRPMKKGMKVYKLYNASFIFRTRSVTIAFDLNTRNGTLSSPSAIKPVVDGCDALFISHNHSDHFDNKVVDLFLDSGKQVFAPEGYRPDDSRITHIRHDGCYRFTAVLGGKEVPVTVFPGHQDDLHRPVGDPFLSQMPDAFQDLHDAAQVVPAQDRISRAGDVHNFSFFRRKAHHQ